jgi:ATP-dependent helicase HrpA
MAALGLGELERFPFVEPPDRRSIRDGVALLHELHAVADAKEREPRLTKTGRVLAQLPVDPRLGRMLVEADRLGCLKEVLVIVSALAIQDPRERPLDKAQAADEMHARFRDETSDFLTLLNLWRHLREQQKVMSSSAFRRMCRQEFLHYLRVREWQDLHSQLRQSATQAGLRLNSAASTEHNIHTAVLSGLLSHIGLYDTERRDYLGARGARFSIFPGSALFRKSPRWVMSAELVETSRLYARVNARIEPEWVEPLASHLVARTFSEPHWERKPAAVIALERVTLYGIPLVTGRKVTYGRIDPVASRDLFIRNALVEGDWDTHHAFLRDNRHLLQEAEDLENRARRRDLVIDEHDLHAFYDARIPDHVVSGAHFDRWWKQARRTEPDLLAFTPEMLLNDRAGEVRVEDYPDRWIDAIDADLSLVLTYQFEPGSDADGVTVHVPLPVLNRLRQETFEWQVPGLRVELITALIKSLPKSLRVSLVPAPDTARELHTRLAPDGGSLTDALEREITRTRGIRIRRDDWDWSRVPEHLTVTFRVVDADGTILGEGKHLDLLREQERASMLAAVAEHAADIERSGMRTWDLDEVPRTYERHHGELVVRGFPALVDERDSVALRVLDSEAEQVAAMRKGVRKLLLLTTPPQHAALERTLGNRERLLLASAPYPNAQALLSDVVSAAVDGLIERHGLPWTLTEFTSLREAARPEIFSASEAALRHVLRALEVRHEVDALVSQTTSPALHYLVEDVTQQVEALMPTGFIAVSGPRLPHISRYLRAVAHRLGKAPGDVARDKARLAEITAVTREVHETLARLPAARRESYVAAELPWMLQELRVNQFAQALGTPAPVSVQRIHRVLDDLEDL